MHRLLPGGSSGNQHGQELRFIQDQSRPGTVAVTVPVGTAAQLRCLCTYKILAGRLLWTRSLRHRGIHGDGSTSSTGRITAADNAKKPSAIRDHAPLGGFVILPGWRVSILQVNMPRYGFDLLKRAPYGAHCPPLPVPAARKGGRVPFG